MNRQLLAAVSAGIIMLAAAAFFYIKRVPQQARVVLKLDNGSDFAVMAHLLNPPYKVNYRDPSMDVDTADPRNTLDGLFSTPNRNTQRYLSLMDEKFQADIRRVDRESGGKILTNSLIGTPLPSTKVLFRHYAELDYGGKNYRVYVGNEILEDGTESTRMSITLVKSGEHWLQSADLDGREFLTVLGLRSYTDLIQMKN